MIDNKFLISKSQQDSTFDINHGNESVNLKIPISKLLNKLQKLFPKAP